MGLREWWKRRGAAREDPRLGRWREAWAVAARAPAGTPVASLVADLEAFGLPEEDVEIEREMLQGLVDREALAAAVRAAGLPTLETGHRVVGMDRCHYSAPASMPDQAGEPAGRLLLTSGRAIFVGGVAALTAAWHTIAEVAQVNRDVVLVRRGRDQLFRFRCNSYSDAMRAAFIAAELVSEQSRPSGL